jgi:hypothetical protein
MKLSNKILNEIADNMEVGFKCFVHKRTHEIIAIPDENRFPGTDINDEENAWADDIRKIDENPDYIEIDSMESSDSFQVMEDFALSLPDGATKIRLLTVLEGHKPFANFNHQIHNAAEEKEQWFKFRREREIEWLKNQLEWRNEV